MVWMSCRCWPFKVLYGRAFTQLFFIFTPSHSHLFPTKKRHHPPVVVHGQTMPLEFHCSLMKGLTGLSRLSLCGRILLVLGQVFSQLFELLLSLSVKEGQLLPFDYLCFCMSASCSCRQFNMLLHICLRHCLLFSMQMHADGVNYYYEN